MTDWTEEFAKELQARRDELRALVDNTAIVQTQAERALATAIIRLIETLAHGSPATPLPTTHHE